MTLQPTHAPRACLLAAALAATFAVPFAPAHAENTQVTAFVEQTDGNQRINLSGKLRMLSQRIAGMACNHAASIEPQQSQEQLQAAITEYDAILNGLENGDPALKIFGAETSVRILHDLQVVRDRWAPFSDVAKTVLDGASDPATIATIAEQSSLLLQDSQQLVLRVVEYHYDRVNTIQAEAFTIDVAGRQRMLAQKMSKNICLLHEQTDIGAAQEDLRNAHNMFDTTLVALRLGMPEVGVNAPPNKDVEEGLKVVAAAWAEIEPLIERALAGDRFDEATRAKLLHDLNALTAKMNEAVQMYVAATEARRA